jgi:hypothetical protein
VKKVVQVKKQGIDYETSFWANITCNESQFVEIESCVSSIRNLENELHFYFDYGEITCELSPNAKIFIHKNGTKLLLSDDKDYTDRATSVGQSFYIFWQQFLNAIANKSINLTSASSSILTTKFIEDIYAAAIE